MGLSKGYNEKKNKSRQVPYWDLISLVFYFVFFAIANKSRNQRPVLKHAKFNTHIGNRIYRTKSDVRVISTQ